MIKYAWKSVWSIQMIHFLFIKYTQSSFTHVFEFASQSFFFKMVTITPAYASSDTRSHFYVNT
jgi:hypothetical protein